MNLYTFEMHLSHIFFSITNPYMIYHDKSTLFKLDKP